MSGYERLAESIANLAARVGESRESADFLFGTVVAEEPVSIQVEQRLILPSGVLIFGEDTVDVIEYIDEETGELKRLYKSNLQNGEQVILAKAMGGEAFVVLGRCYAI